MSRPNVGRFLDSVRTRGLRRAVARTLISEITPRIIGKKSRGLEMKPVDGAYGPLLRVSNHKGLLGFARSEDDAVLHGIYEGGSLIGLRGLNGRRKTSFRLVTTRNGKVQLQADAGLARRSHSNRFRVLYEIDAGSHGREIFLSDNVVGLLRE